jgi:hypothetical protein
MALRKRDKVKGMLFLTEIMPSLSEWGTAEAREMIEN